MRIVVLFVAFSIGTVLSTCAQRYEYIVEDLGVLPGQTSSTARGINYRGDVVGWSDSMPFLYTDSTGIISLGAFSGASATWAVDINDNRVIVGGARQGTTEFAIRYTGTIWQDLGLGFSYAYDINNLGQIVGSQGADSFNPQALLIQPDGTRTTLIYGVARAINDHGYVVGYNNDRIAFLYKPGQGVQLLSPIQGFVLSFATAINSLNEVAGYLHNGRSGTLANSVVFLYREGQGMVNLGGLGSLNEVWGMNAAGQIVGRYFPQAGNEHLYRAFVYDPQRGFRNLNQLVDPAGGWVLLWANGINERGQIACSAFNNLIPGSRAVRLTPIPRGDINMNGCVDDQDLLTVLFAFGSTGGDADLDRNGVVDDGDLLIVLFNFGVGCD